MNGIFVANVCVFIFFCLIVCIIWVAPFTLFFSSSTSLLYSFHHENKLSQNLVYTIFSHLQKKVNLDLISSYQMTIMHSFGWIWKTSSEKITKYTFEILVEMIVFPFRVYIFGICLCSCILREKTVGNLI